MEATNSERVYDPELFGCPGQLTTNYVAPKTPVISYDHPKDNIQSITT